MSQIHSSTDKSGWLGRRKKDICTLRHDIACRWYVYLPIAIIWTLAANRVLVDPSLHTPLLFNWTASLPYKVAWLHWKDANYSRGDFIIFRFEGEAKAFYPGLANQPFFKIIRGVAGDRITVKDRQVFINGAPVGFAKQYTFDHRQLEPISEGAIPIGHFYVQGTDRDSFDSRYQSSGLIRADQIIGRVTPLF
jgi:conjugal transfer pilin signal peptidase TrbI